MLVGWGFFNVVEGLIDHQILGLHHVREGAGHQSAYDLGFLAFGALLVICGGSSPAPRRVSSKPHRSRFRRPGPYLFFLLQATSLSLRASGLGDAGSIL